jgi:hypothetical protein
VAGQRIIIAIGPALSEPRIAAGEQGEGLDADHRGSADRQRIGPLQGELVVPRPAVGAIRPSEGGAEVEAVIAASTRNTIIAPLLHEKDVGAAVPVESICARRAGQSIGCLARLGRCLRRKYPSVGVAGVETLLHICIIPAEHDVARRQCGGAHSTLDGCRCSAHDKYIAGSLAVRGEQLSIGIKVIEVQSYRADRGPGDGVAAVIGGGETDAEALVGQTDRRDLDNSADQYS